MVGEHSNCRSEWTWDFLDSKHQSPNDFAVGPMQRKNWAVASNSWSKKNKNSLKYELPWKCTCVKPDFSWPFFVKYSNFISPRILISLYHICEFISWLQIFHPQPQCHGSGTWPWYSVILVVTSEYFQPEDCTKYLEWSALFLEALKASFLQWRPFNEIFAVAILWPQAGFSVEPPAYTNRSSWLNQSSKRPIRGESPI